MLGAMGDGNTAALSLWKPTDIVTLHSLPPNAFSLSPCCLSVEQFYLPHSTEYPLPATPPQDLRCVERYCGNTAATSRDGGSEQVFTTYELIEKIILELSLEHVLATTVCRYWREVIAKSMPIRWRLWGDVIMKFAFNESGVASSKDVHIPDDNDVLYELSVIFCSAEKALTSGFGLMKHSFME